MKNAFLFSFAFIIIACSGSRKMNTTNNLLQPAFDKQGHRGCRGLMPENTIPAMLKAMDWGVTTLEMDAVITKDKQVVLSHDPYFNHKISTKPNGEYVTEEEEKRWNIYTMTYEEVKGFDVGLKPHPDFPQQQKLRAFKPLLSETIDSVEQYCKLKNVPPVFYNIETKSMPSTDHIYHPGPDEFVDLLMDVILSKKIEDRVTIQSFDIRTLQYLHRVYPSIKTSLLIEDAHDDLESQLAALGFHPTIYSPNYQLVTSSLIRQCHQKGIQIIPWTVNRKASIQRLKRQGVDGIITDYPNLF